MEVGGIVGKLANWFPRPTSVGCAGTGGGGKAAGRGVAIILAGDTTLGGVREAGVKGRDVEEKAVKAEELVGGCTGNRGFVSRF